MQMRLAHSVRRVRTLASSRPLRRTTQAAESNHRYPSLTLRLPYLQQQRLPIPRTTLLARGSDRVDCVQDAKLSSRSTIPWQTRRNSACQVSPHQQLPNALPLCSRKEECSFLESSNRP